MVGADVEIAEVDQRVRDGVLIALRPLNAEDLAVALFRSVKIVHEGAGVAQITKGIRQFTLFISCAIIGDGGFPGGAGLDHIAAMEKNLRAMFVIVRHVFVKRDSVNVKLGIRLLAVKRVTNNVARLSSTKSSRETSSVSAFGRVSSKLGLNLVLFFRT